MTSTPFTKTTFRAMLALVLLGLVLFFVNILFGSVVIDFQDILQILIHDHTQIDPAKVAIVRSFRFPQAVVAAVAGAALAVAGLLMQTLFRNPLADPSILGISAGSSLGVAILLMATAAFSGASVTSLGIWASLGVGFAAFSGALLVLILILIISTRVRNVVSLLIVGIMIAYIAGSLTGLLKYYSSKEDVQAFVIWGMGTFSNVGYSQLPFFTILLAVGIFATFFLAKPLNIMLLGENYAKNLGLHVRRNSFYIILLSGYLTAVVTAYAGPIAFIGLAVPHIARNLFRTSDHRILIPGSILAGMALALFCNLIARLPGLEGNLPINSVTSLIGAPFVIWIIMRKRQLTS
jgi:iron complex transport system permease protein